LFCVSLADFFVGLFHSFNCLLFVVFSFVFFSTLLDWRICLFHWLICHIVNSKVLLSLCLLFVSRWCSICTHKLARQSSCRFNQQSPVLGLDLDLAIDSNNSSELRQSSKRTNRQQARI
jgi:hypothetical protein